MKGCLIDLTNVELRVEMEKSFPQRNVTQALATKMVFSNKR